MKIRAQKNVYYVDLNKNLYRGYLETQVARASSERILEYCSRHHVIDEVAVLGSDVCLSIEYVKRPVSSTASKAECRAATDLDDQSLRNSDGTIIDNDCVDSFLIKFPEDFTNTSFTLRIVFHPTPKNPDIHWYIPVGPKDKQKEIVAFGASTYSHEHSSSSTVPYVDAVVNYELIYIVPNTEDVRVVSSGTFHAIREEDKNIIYSYKATAHASRLVFAIGTYDQTDIFGDGDPRRVLVPANWSDLSDIQGDLQCIIRFIEGFVKTETLGSVSVLFTMIETQIVSYSDVIVCNASFLSGSTDIEPAYRLKRLLCNALSSCIFGLFEWSPLDSWVPAGLIGYVSDHAIRALLGSNEFLWAYKTDKDYVLSNDVLEPPLFYTARKPIAVHSRFFQTKSRLVFHCLEAQLSVAFLQKIADEVIATKSQEGVHIRHSTSSDDPNRQTAPAGPTAASRGCFTATLMKIVKETTGKDMRPFFDTYVFAPGLLRIRLTLQIHRKKNMVKVVMNQTPTSLLKGCNKRYSGALLLKAIEAEGSFDHDVVVDGENTFFYHTRAKKKRREEEEEAMPLLFVRADPKRECLFDIVVEQPDYMHVEQLLERNVVGQLEAIDSLVSKPTIPTCEALERVLDSNHVFYRIRARLCHVLRSIEIEGYNGLQRLIQYFVRTRCVPNSTVIKGNEFGLISYFIQKHLVKAIAQDLSNTSADDLKLVVAFLENILKFNDNSLSSFDDAWYLATVINCLSRTVVRLCRSNNTAVGGILSHCLDEIERLRILDTVFPSNGNVITRACLISLVRFSHNGLVLLRKDTLVSLSLYPNITSIRLVAIEGLFVLFQDSFCDVLGSVLSDSSCFIYEVLKIILRILKIFSKNMDGSGRPVELGSKERESVCRRSEPAGSDFVSTLRGDRALGLLRTIFRLHCRNIFIRDCLEDVLLFAEGRYVRNGEFSALVIAGFNNAKEETVRNVVLETAGRARTIRLSSLNTLRERLLSAEGIVRLPRSKRQVPCTASIAPHTPCRVRLPVTHFVPKNIDGVIFKLKIPQRRIVYRKADVPALLISKVREHHAASYLDDFIRRVRPTNFFEWVPLPFKRIQEQCVALERSSREKGQGHGVPSYLCPEEDKNRMVDGENTNNLSSYTLSNVYWVIERSLIYVLSYASFKGKMYFAAKVIFNLIERLVFAHAFIQPSVVPMSVEMRACCDAFLEVLIAEPGFAPFVPPVDHSELRNYLDIVRVPACLSDVRARMDTFLSYDAFIIAVDRIYRNCLSFNNAESDIASAARRLRATVDAFKIQILRRIVAENTREGHRVVEDANGVDVCNFDRKNTENLSVELRDSYLVLETIISSVNEEGHFSELIADLRNMGSWGDLETALTGIRRRYSRYSVNGKACMNGVKEIKRLITAWFSVENGRVLCICD